LTALAVACSLPLLGHLCCPLLLLSPLNLFPRCLACDISTPLSFSCCKRALFRSHPRYDFLCCHLLSLSPLVDSGHSSIGSLSQSLSSLGWPISDHIFYMQFAQFACCLPMLVSCLAYILTL
jgi:hypothetical protein